MASSTDEDMNSNPTPNNEQPQQPQTQQPLQQQQPVQPPQQFTAVNNAPLATATLANGSSAPTAPMNGNPGAISIATTNAPHPPQPQVTTSIFGGAPTLTAPSLPSANGGRPSGSPEVQIPTVVGDDAWSARADSQDPGAPGQKRKRTPDEMDRDGRAVSPTTQTQRHHLAAHEAALGGVPATQDIRAQSIHIPQEEHYPVADDHRFHDEGPSFRAPQDGSPQPGEKRRKRVFSNRTKTGCITCRRRKKKCDEGKPECELSWRSSGICLDYPSSPSQSIPHVFPTKFCSKTFAGCVCTPRLSWADWLSCSVLLPVAPCSCAISWGGCHQSWRLFSRQTTAYGECVGEQLPCKDYNYRDFLTLLSIILLA